MCGYIRQSSAQAKSLVVAVCPFKSRTQVCIAGLCSPTCVFHQFSSVFHHSVSLERVQPTRPAAGAHSLLTSLLDVHTTAP